MKPTVAKAECDVIVVIPVGPNTSVNFVRDTIDSYCFYTKTTYKFIIADDSHQGIGKKLQALYPDIDVLTTPRPMGGWAGLYINEATAFRYAVSNYNFIALLKLDTDALIIGERPEEDALKLFATNSTVGMAGQYPNDYDNNPWDINWPRDRVLNGTTTWKFIRRPFANWYLRKLYIKAKANGYKTGESVFGGAYFMSYACLKKLLDEGLLPHAKLIGLNMGEDHIFSLLVKAIGFNLGTLSSKGLPFALAWKGLPASPEQLYKEGKKIIHSTRFWNDLKEEDIRRYFKQQREAVPVAVS
jgi:hypothetical protein